MDDKYDNISRRCDIRIVGLNFKSTLQFFTVCALVRADTNP